MKIIIPIIFLQFCVLQITSQNFINKDSTSIISFVDKIIIKANLDTKSESFSFNETNNTIGAKFLTNSEYRLTVSLDYEFIGFSFGFSPKFIPGNNDDALKGESSFVDYKFRFFINNWTQEISYAKVQGFYIDNTGDFIPDWTEGQDEFIQFPNLKFTSWRGSTAYVFNDKFSLRNVAYNTEWQVKSAGSLIPTLNYSYTRGSARIDTFEIYEDTFDLRLSPDYYYTFVIEKNWFITPYVSPSFGIRFSKEREEGIDTNNIYYPWGLDAGIQLGYSSERIIFGANLDFESNWYNETSQSRIVNDRLFAKLYFGYRFGSPKFIKKIVDKINKKI